jgi:hypothetical protein
MKKFVADAMLPSGAMPSALLRGRSGPSVAATISRALCMALVTLVHCSSSSDGPAAPAAADAGVAAQDGAPDSAGGPASDSAAVSDAPEGDGASLTDAADAASGPAGPVYPQPGGAPGPGVLPPKAANVSYLGTLGYDDPEIARDLGFSGVVNGQIVWTFGDTLLRPPDGGSALFCSSDSAALGDLLHPLAVHDKNLTSSGCTREWIPYDASEIASGGGGRFGEGGTNVIEYAPGKGLVWFLKNDRGTGGAGIVGAGVATVTADASGPVATRVDDTMWTSYEPWWGDVGVTYDALDQSAYVFGHGPSSAMLDGYVFLAKVPAAQATDVSAYQYWDASAGAWTTRRFSNGQLGTLALTSAQALFPLHALGQSNAFWSTYYNTWMFVYGTSFGYSDVMVMTAPRLEGPWTKGFSIASTCPNNICGAIRYAIVPHPEYDPTGKTLLVTWTDANSIYAARIEWL